MAIIVRLIKKIIALHTYFVCMCFYSENMSALGKFQVNVCSLLDIHESSGIYSTYIKLWSLSSLAPMPLVSMILHFVFVNLISLGSIYK